MFDVRNRSSTSIALDTLSSFVDVSCSGSVDFDRYLIRHRCKSGNSDCKRNDPSTLVSLCFLELQAKSYDLFRRTDPKIQKRKLIQSLYLDSRWCCINAQCVPVVLSKSWAIIFQFTSVSITSIVCCCFILLSFTGFLYPRKLMNVASGSIITGEYWGVSMFLCSHLIQKKNLKRTRSLCMVGSVPGGLPTTLVPR